MYYLIYLTERCNLACQYCDSRESRQRFLQDIDYPLAALADFLGKDPECALQFYGGEPLLCADLLAEIVRLAHPKHVVVQTNGLLLDRLQPPLLHAVDLVSISLDGDRELTDRGRGAGTYDRAIAQAQALRERGFRGRIDVRMTISPGTRIYDAVSHFVGACAFAFDGVYWQLNVLFHEIDWRRDRRFLEHWVARAYNPDVSRLVDLWAGALTRGDKPLRLVPFAALMHDILSGDRVSGVRCGAGQNMWTITTDGQVFPCPVMRGGKDHSAGHISTLHPAALGANAVLLPPCDRCEVLGLCGGRCLCANQQQRWGEEGFRLVCDTVKHLIAELQRVAPSFEAAVAAGRLALDDLAVGSDYEVIP